MSYNGWTNYETWLVALWIDNDQGLYSMVQEWAEDAESPIALGEMIKDFLLENTPTTSGTLYDDLLCSAIRAADYREIAQAFLAE